MRKENTELKNNMTELFYLGSLCFFCVCVKFFFFLFRPVFRHLKDLFTFTSFFGGT